MKCIRIPEILLLVIALTLLSCTKNDLPVIEDPAINRDIHINSLFNIINLDDGFLVTGTSNSKVMISKLDVNFNTVWEKNNYEWGTQVSGGGWGSSFYSVIVKNVFTDEQRNLICFCATLEGGDVVWSSVLIVKLDRSGNEIKRVELVNTTLVDVIKTRDNGYLLAGNKLTKINADLSRSWEYDDQNYVFSGTRLINTNDDGFALTGTWNSDQVLFQRMNERGNIQWTKNSFNQNPFNDSGFDLSQLTNGGFLIIGRTRDLTPPWDINCFVIRTDISGDTIWTQKFGEESDDWLESFIYASNNDFIIKQTVGFPNDTIHKTILLRMSSDGQIIDSKETVFEKLIYANSGYFVKAVRIGDNTLRFSKVQMNELFSK